MQSAKSPAVWRKMAAKQGKGIRGRCMSCWRKQHPEPRDGAAPSTSPNHGDDLLRIENAHDPFVSGPIVTPDKIAHRYEE